MHGSSDQEAPLFRSGARAPGETAADARPEPAAPKPGLTARVADASFLESVLNASQDCIKVLTYDGELVFMNNGGRAVMEVEDFEVLRGCPWIGFWEGDGRIEAQAALDTARAGGTGHFQGAADTARGTPKFWDVTVTRVPGANGARDHILSISRDITDSKRAEALRDLLAHELSHRVKNSLSVVQAIAMQTFKAGDKAQLDVFNARLTAMGQAQDLLLQAAWEPVQMRDVVEASLGPICPAGRCTADGDDYALDAQRGLALALALHELGTNAAKYGALSRPGGRVRVSWTAGDGELRLTWVESGGPPVAEPSRKGFGTRLITRNLEADFGGTVELNYAQSGLVLTLVAPA